MRGHSACVGPRQQQMKAVKGECEIGDEFRARDKEEEQNNSIWTPLGESG